MGQYWRMANIHRPLAYTGHQSRRCSLVCGIVPGHADERIIVARRAAPIRHKIAASPSHPARAKIILILQVARGGSHRPHKLQPCAASRVLPSGVLTVPERINELQHSIINDHYQRTGNFGAYRLAAALIRPPE